MAITGCSDATITGINLAETGIDEVFWEYFCRNQF